ncbi:MAG: transposase [Actinomycetota bacterium]|nr:transposase [Actinomycetota bacterium]
MLDSRSLEEMPVDGREVQGAVGDRNGSPVGRAPSVGSVAEPELAERPRRRRFTAEYKLRVLREAEACTRKGEIGAMLRREGLYTSHLTAWRKQRDAGALEGLAPRKRGPRGPSPEQVENQALRRQLDRTQADLETARRVIEVQGNVSALLEDLLAPKSATETDGAPPRR